VTSWPPPGRPTPRSSSSVARTKASRSKPGSENGVTGHPYPFVSSEVETRHKQRYAKSDLVNEAGHHVAVGAADLHLRARAQHQEALAVGVRPYLANLVEIDDRRAVHPLEHARVEPALEILHRLAQDQRVVAGIDAHV